MMSTYAFGFACITSAVSSRPLTRLCSVCGLGTPVRMTCATKPSAVSSGGFFPGAVATRACAASAAASEVRTASARVSEYFVFSGAPHTAPKDVSRSAGPSAPTPAVSAPWKTSYASSSSLGASGWSGIVLNAARAVSAFCSSLHRGIHLLAWRRRGVLVSRCCGGRERGLWRRPRLFTPL